MTILVLMNLGFAASAVTTPLALGHRAGPIVPGTPHREGPIVPGTGRRSA